MRSLVGKLFLASFSVALSLLLLEALLHLVPGAISPGERHRKLFAQYDDELGWALVPNRVNQHVSPEYEITESVNSKGLRGTDYAYEKPEGTLRILVLGDSFAEGYTVEFEELFSHLLERNLASDGPVQVINSGVSGYSTDQELIFFQSEGVRYEPDLTILLFYYNDIWSNNQPSYGSYTKPRFLARDGQLVRIPPRPQDEEAKSGVVATKPSSRAGALRHWLVAHSKIYMLVRNGLMQIPGVRHTLEGAGLVARAGPSAEGVFARKLHSKVESAWQITERLLVELDRAAAAHGSEFLAFFVPSEYHIEPDRWASMSQSRGWLPEAWSSGQPAKTFREVCERQQLDCLEPSERFHSETAALSEGSLYFPLDGHWNADGHRLVAEILAAAVRSRRANPLAPGS